MIIDTTYIFTLSGIEIETDLLDAIDVRKTAISFDEISISLISLFELQAKIAKLKLPPKLAVDAIKVINNEFRVEPFYNPKIIEVADLLSRELKDYIDCLILATAIALKEDLVTEDSLLKEIRVTIKQKYGISMFSYKDIVK